MFLNISFQQKDLAKTAFRQAGVPLTWNPAQKKWETSATSLPTSLQQYAEGNLSSTSSAPIFYYLAQESGPPDFPFCVEAIFNTREELRQHILSGAWLRGWAGEEDMFAEAAVGVKATRRIAVGKHIPRGAVKGYNPLRYSKDPEIRAIVEKAITSGNCQYD